MDSWELRCHLFLLGSKVEIQSLDGTDTAPSHGVIGLSIDPHQASMVLNDQRQRINISHQCLYRVCPLDHSLRSTRLLGILDRHPGRALNIRPLSSSLGSVH